MILPSCIGNVFIWGIYIGDGTCILLVVRIVDEIVFDIFGVSRGRVFRSLNSIAVSGVLLNSIVSFLAISIVITNSEPQPQSRLTTGHNLGRGAAVLSATVIYQGHTCMHLP